jgi:hypothetical protein
MEIKALALMGAGALLGVIGYLWLICRGWQVRWYWALLLLFIPPLGLLFLVLHFRKAVAPVALLLLGAIVATAPVVYTHLAKPDLGPFVYTDPDGNLIVGLNGWDRTDYSALQAYPGVVKLEMANPDVTDQTLVFIKDCKDLRELDLNRTQVGDDGLAVIAGLPKLEVLHMRGTKVTDAGFKKYLEPLATLKQIDFRDTGVTLDTQKEWKKAQKGRKYYKE